jgi:hypothetical protein
MADNHVFEHSTNSIYGENIAMTSDSDTDALIQSIDMFYDEVLIYDYNNPGFKKETGHFTQLVWMDTQEIGLGVSKSSEGYTYVCTNYYPPGNYVDKFFENVKPIMGPSIVATKEPSSPSHSLLPHQPPSPSQSPSPSQYQSPLPRSPPIQPHPLPFQHQSVNHITYPPSRLSPSPFYHSSRYTLSIKYPQDNTTHVDNVLCPAIETIFGEKCIIQLKSSTGIYYGTRTDMDYNILRQMIAHNLDEFTQSGKIVCGSTITLYLNGDDLFRYQASKITCLW